MDALNLFVCEAQALPLRSLSKVGQLRHRVDSLRQELVRDAQVMEFLSLRTKTPYVQFSTTKQFARQTSTDAPNAFPSADALRAGAISIPVADSKPESYAGLTTASTTSLSDGVGAAGGADTTGGGAVSTFAAPTSDPTSLPPM